MLETLRAWLNGKKDFATGVGIYEQLGSNEDLLTLFKKGSNEFRERRLQEELLSICNELKSKQNADTKSNPNRSNVIHPGPKAGNKLHQEKQVRSNIQSKFLPKLSEETEGQNPELYNLCKIEADKSYKELMNLRAQLFAMAPADDFTSHNTPDKINLRAKLCIDVVKHYQKLSQLYDRADHVKTHGRLPDQEDDEVNEYDHLPEHLIKQKLDNARKAFNKLKDKEPTAERIVLLQKHKTNIEKLEKKWHSLAQQ